MKCSNCGYISFDYNQACPKCDKDTGAERTKLNLPDYRSNPPFLLGALTGEANESEVEIQMDYLDDTEVTERQKDMSLVNSSETETDENLLENAEKITVQIDKKKGRIWAEA
jgi:hypothetical protein